MKLLKILLLILAPLQADVILENFSTWRNNGEGTKLWDVYLGEDPGQTASVANGIFSATVPNVAGRNVYIHFFPKGAQGYSGPDGRMKSYVKSGTWDPDYNRMTFFMRTNKAHTARPDGGYNFQIGTYIHGADNSDPAYQGAHYYHYANLELAANVWYGVTLNRWPQHQVGGDNHINWPEDPEYAGGTGPHYFDGLTRFYLNSHGDGWQGSTWQIGDFRLSKELNAPDDEVGTIVYGYDGTSYILIWSGIRNVGRIYEVRYSTNPITNWASATDGGTATNPGSDYQGVIWKKVTPELTTGVYAAIRVQGQTKFTQVHIPYHMAPGTDITVPPPDSVPPVCVPQIVRETTYVNVPYPVVYKETTLVVPISKIFRGTFQFEP